MSTYVVSDLRGQYHIFMNLLEKAAFSDSDKLYMLGDEIDRGSDGIMILQHVMKSSNMHFLLGNHEFMMLNSVAANGSAPAKYSVLPGRDSS
jgi:serine/threonine protein phosphatase 1